MRAWPPNLGEKGGLYSALDHAAKLADSPPARFKLIVALIMHGPGAGCPDGHFRGFWGCAGARFLQVSAYYGHVAGKSRLFLAVLNCAINNDNLYCLCCFFDTISLKPLKSSENSTFEFVNVFL